MGAKTIRITGTSGCDTCECCGGYSWERYRVELDGKPVLDHRGDGHLGGGEWHSWEDALREILPALGFALEIDLDYEGER